MKKGTLLRLGLPEFPKTAGTAKEFRDWDLKLEREYPIRYKIHKTLTKVGHRLFLFPVWRIQDAIRWVKYRVVPKHKYTTIKLKTLEPGYYDPDTLILHTVFEIFEDFMKIQLSDRAIVKWTLTKEDFEDFLWEEDPEGTQKVLDEKNDLWKEMNELYDWWVNIYPNRESTLPEYPELPEEWGFLAVVNEDFQDEPLMKEWKAIADIHNKAERDWDDEEQEMLIRLMRIRKNLWD